MENALWESDIVYSIDDEGVLHLKGTGRMPDFGTWEAAPPWRYGRKEIQKVVVGDGIQSLGAYAFCGMKITEISLPNTVISIGKHCFEQCKELRTFVCPPRVTQIPSSAFKDCEALEWVTLPQGMEQLWRWSFQNCTNLKGIRIPASMRRINTTAFWGANLNALHCAGSQFMVENDCLYHWGWYGRILLTAAQTAEEIVVKDGTTIIADHSFYKHPILRRVTCPPSLYLVDKNAFFGCEQLERIVLKGRRPQFEKGALSHCGRLNLTSGEKNVPTIRGKKLAATRNSYASLIDGEFKFHTCGERSEWVETSQQFSYDDLVDIKGGFNFIIGLRACGEVTGNFPGIEKWRSVAAIAAAEGRVAGLTTDGAILHEQKNCFEQNRITVPSGKFRSVDVYFDGLWAVSEDGDVICTPESHHTGPIMESYRCVRQEYGVEFAKVVCWAEYYCTLITAALTTDGQVFWNMNGGRTHRLPVEHVQAMAVCNGQIGVLTEEGEVYFASSGKDENHVFHICGQAESVELMFDKKILVIKKDGSVLCLDAPKGT